MSNQLQRRRPQAPRPRAGTLARLMAGDDGHELTVEQVDTLLDGTPEVEEAFTADVISSVLDAFIDDAGRLVPAKVAELGPLSESAEQRARRAKMLDELRANAWSTTTLYNYGRALTRWRAWCAERDIPAVPFEPSHVATYLLDYTFVFDENGEPVRDEEGNLVARIVSGTADMQLSALNKAAEFIGLPRPGDNEGVRELMRGLRRTLLTAAEAPKKAIDASRLERMLSVLTPADYNALRLRTAILLRARTDLTAGQLSGLSWVDVDFLKDGRAVLTLPKSSRNGSERTVRIAPHRTNTHLCAVTALRELRKATAASGTRLDLVMTHWDGSEYTRQALHHAVNKATASIGGWGRLPGADDRALASVVGAPDEAPSTATARNRALLHVGFWGALRRSNIAALNWRDLTDYEDDGIEVILRTSKTDQEGQGDTVWIPHRTTDDIESAYDNPAGAVRAWKAVLTDALGRQPRGDEPVFVSLTAEGTVKMKSDRPVRMPAEAINGLVQQLAEQAGLTDGQRDAKGRHAFGAHSLRAGFITEAAMKGMSVTDIQSVSKHKNVDVLVRYVRMTQARKQNASRRLFDMLNN